jgi:deoxyribodipyrimidine photolyase
MLWFRKGLRLHDNGALHAALEASPQTLTPVFCLDPWQVYHAIVRAVTLFPTL